LKKGKGAAGHGKGGKKNYAAVFDWGGKKPPIWRGGEKKKGNARNSRMGRRSLFSHQEKGWREKKKKNDNSLRHRF